MQHSPHTNPMKLKTVIQWILVLCLLSVAVFLCVRPFLISHYMHESAHMFHHGHFDQARALYRKIILLDKDNEYAWDWLIYSVANEGMIDEALEAGMINLGFAIHSGPFTPNISISVFNNPFG